MKIRRKKNPSPGGMAIRSVPSHLPQSYNIHRCVNKFWYATYLEILNSENTHLFAMLFPKA